MQLQRYVQSYRCSRGKAWLNLSGEVREGSGGRDFVVVGWAGLSVGKQN